MAKPPSDDELIASLQKWLKPDKDDLDEEFIAHPELIYHITSAYEAAVLERDACKIEIDQAEAEIHAQLIEKAEESTEKWTDTSIKRQVTSSVRMIKLHKKFLSIKERVGKLNAMKEALSQRGYSLNKLSDLYVANYFTRESGGKRRSEIAEDIAARNRKEAGELRRKKKG